MLPAGCPDDSQHTSPVDLISDMKNMRFDAIPKAPLKKKNLESLSSNKIDGKLITKVNTLEQEKLALQNRVKIISQQLRESKKAATAMEEKLSESSGTSGPGDGKALELARKQIKELKEALDGKLSASKQFQSLKMMLAKKNGQLKLLRTQLNKVDPSAISIED
ncbi:hypothetical protein AAMO2058_001169400 [Amorphochlora amoebiformis]